MGTWNGPRFGGGPGDDTAVGTAADETLVGSYGNDHLSGAGGNDSLSGDDGSDTLFGGSGDDILNDSAGDDRSFGGSGNDRLVARIGADRVDGGAGDDLIEVTGLDTFADSISGGADHDLLDFRVGGISFAYRIVGDLGVGARIYADGTLVARVAGIEALSMAGGAGDDTLIGGSGRDALDLILGSDRASTGAGNDTVTFWADVATDIVDLGAGGDDLAVIVNGSLGLVFNGGSATAIARDVGGTLSRITGAERFEIRTINGVVTNEVLTGGAGADSFWAARGSDTLRGGAGNDTLGCEIDGSFDSINGHSGTDILQLIGVQGGFNSEGFDMTGSGATSVVVDLYGQTVVSASSIESVHVLGSYAADTLVGTSFADSLDGSGGNDTIRGGGGADRIEGEFGNDALYGGGAGDTFVFATKATGVPLSDTIHDFGGADRIEVDISAWGSTLPPGTPAVLIAGSAPVAIGNSPVFLYDTDDGRLILDDNGAVVGRETLLATLFSGGTSPAVLTAHQILIV